MSLVEAWGWVRKRSLVALACVSLFAVPAGAVPISIVYGDAEGEGFFDPDLGTGRRAALEFAVDRWAALLAGSVDVVVEARMDGLGGTGADALLASTGAVTLHRNFAGGQPDTWYAAALANQLSGGDVNGAEMPEIAVTFNADIDGLEVLGSVGWYYGLDAQPGADIDFVTIALHEIGHGLNFAELVDGVSGGWRLENQPGIFDRMLVRPRVRGLVDMLPAERLAAIVSTGELLFNGPRIVAFNGSPIPVHVPEPFQQGASVGHWDPSLTPDELMEPSYTTAIHDPGALLPALADMGWELAVSTPTPRASPATPTTTLPPRATARPARTPRAQHEFAYVTNFDDATVSVIDTAARNVTATIGVGDGPIGVAASPDGTRLYVANFHASSLSALSTRSNRVLATISVGDSANGVVVTPDGVFAVVTDTAAARVAIVTTDPFELLTRVTAGVQPSGIALDPQGRLAFVTNFGGQAITVVDLDARLRRALIPLSEFERGPLGIAIAPATERGYVTLSGGYVVVLDALNLARREIFTGLTFNRPEGVVMSADGALAYFSGYIRDSGAGQVAIVRTDRNEWLASVNVDNVPEALALSTDERTLYVANTGSNTVSVIDTERRRRVATIPVGAAPMGVVVVEVPETTCDGDCDIDGTVTVNELVQAVAIVLEKEDVSACEAADRDGSGTVMIAELVGATQNLLRGCD